MTSDALGGDGLAPKMGACSRAWTITRLLRYAGLFTWALVGLPLLYTAQFPPEALDDSQPPSMAWQGWSPTPRSACCTCG